MCAPRRGYLPGAHGWSLRRGLRRLSTVKSTVIKLLALNDLSIICTDRQPQYFFSLLFICHTNISPPSSKSKLFYNYSLHGCLKTHRTTSETFFTTESPTIPHYPRKGSCFSTFYGTYSMQKAMRLSGERRTLLPRRRLKGHWLAAVARPARSLVAAPGLSKMRRAANIGGQHRPPPPLCFPHIQDPTKFPDSLQVKHVSVTDEERNAVACVEEEHMRGSNLT